MALIHQARNGPPSKSHSTGVSLREFRQLKVELRACTEQVERLQRQIGALQNELYRLREKVRT
jgi:predicted RNase H-like nuclease (RuvC/YqgF family)